MRWLAGNGAHGVTRPTTPVLATRSRGVAARLIYELQKWKAWWHNIFRHADAIPSNRSRETLK